MKKQNRDLEIYPTKPEKIPTIPEKDVPLKPDTDPDPTKKPEKNDPTRTDEPTPLKPEQPIKTGN